MSAANNPKLSSWVKVPRHSDFPIQNLPFGIIKHNGKLRAAVAIGDQVLDLAILHEQKFLDGLDLPANVFSQQYLNDFFSLGRKKIGAVRERVSVILRDDNPELRDAETILKQALIP